MVLGIAKGGGGGAVWEQTGDRGEKQLAASLLANAANSRRTSNETNVEWQAFLRRGTVASPHATRNKPSHDRPTQPRPPGLDVAPHRPAALHVLSHARAHLRAIRGGRRTRIVACTGPQPTGASLLALRGRFMAATAPKSHVSGFSASWQLIERCCHTARSFLCPAVGKKTA